MEWGRYCGCTKEVWEAVPDRIHVLVSAHANEVWVSLFNKAHYLLHEGCLDPLPVAFEKHSPKEQGEFTAIVSSYRTYLTSEWDNHRACCRG